MNSRMLKRRGKAAVLVRSGLRACCAKAQHGVRVGYSSPLLSFRTFICRWTEASATFARIRCYSMLSRRVFDHPCAAPAYICLLATLTASSINAASVRGASPHLLSQYDTNVETFRCLDGSKSIHRSRVNDDYCDCVDGSDEPGLATQLSVVL